MNISNFRNFLEKHKYILAPMAGVNDTIFRELCIKYGADLTYTEMVSSKGLQYNNDNTHYLLELSKNEEKVVVQIFGHESDTMADQAQYLSQELNDKLAYIDINMGCPARKIVKKGDGSALMLDPDLAENIVEKCVKSSSVPITVKFRRGYELGNDTSLEFAKRMENAGASAICVHGRYAMQYYRGDADWQCVNEITKNVNIPVIGSGDITSKVFADKVINDYGVDAIMIGRAARGNPWVFNEIKGLIDGVSLIERLDTCKYHVEQYSKQNPRMLSYMRKHCMWYIHGLPGAAAIRNMITHCETLDDYVQLLERLKEEINIR